jgi:predicted permease
VQLALSVLLLVGAGLFARSLQRAADVDPGFAVEDGLLVGIDAGTLGRSPAEVQELYRRLVADLAAQPGVRGATLMMHAPLGLSSAEGTVYAGDDAVRAGFNVVGPGYVTTMGIRLVRGRDFDAGDRAGAAPVVVVNETLARRLFPGADPIGQLVRLGRESPPATIVGVAADTKYSGLGERDRAFIYEPVLQRYRGDATLLVRADPALASVVQERVRAVEPGLPVSEVRTLADQVRLALLPARAGALLLGGFGLLALGLAAIGVYGLVAYSVRQRTREIAVRVALGASRGAVLKLVVGRSVALVGAGVGIGLALALASTRLASGFLYGVTATDPVTFIGVAVVMLGVAGLASWLPARRAVRMDPMVALRGE